MALHWPSLCSSNKSSRLYAVGVDSPPSAESIIGQFQTRTVHHRFVARACKGCRRCTGTHSGTPTRTARPCRPAQLHSPPPPDQSRPSTRPRLLLLLLPLTNNQNTFIRRKRSTCTPMLDNLRFAAAGARPGENAVRILTSTENCSHPIRNRGRPARSSTSTCPSAACTTTSSGGCRSTSAIGTSLFSRKTGKGSSAPPSACTFSSRCPVPLSYPDWTFH